jgi:hypothetical protein
MMTALRGLWQRVGGERRLLARVLNDEVVAGRIDYHSTSRRYRLNGGLPADLKAALLALAPPDPTRARPPAIFVIANDGRRVARQSSARSETDRARERSQSGSELVRSLRTGPGAEIARTTPKLLSPPPFSIAGHAAAS